MDQYGLGFTPGFVGYNRDAKFTLQCFSKSNPGPHAAQIGKRRRTLEGNKICLPPEVLAQLQIRFRHRMPSPMFFKITNHRYNKSSHCGLIDFDAPRNSSILSDGFFEDMMLLPGQTASFALRELPKLTYVKFQPFRWQFARIRDPKAVLTRELQDHYVALSEGDVVTIEDNESKKFRLTCVEVKSSHRKQDVKEGSILNTDLTVEFAAPVEKAPETKLIRMNTATREVSRAKKYAYFRVKIVDPYVGISFSITAEDEGLVQLFVCTKNQYVTRRDCMWFVTSADKKPLVISPEHKEFSKSWYYCSVYSPANVAYSLHVSEDRDSAQESSLGGWGAAKKSPTRNSRKSRGHSLSPSRRREDVKEGGRQSSDAKSIREARLAALSRYAKRPGTPPSDRRSRDAKPRMSIPSLIRQKSSEVRKIRSARMRGIAANMDRAEREEIANAGKQLFAQLIRKTSSEPRKD